MQKHKESTNLIWSHFVSFPSQHLKQTKKIKDVQNKLWWLGWSFFIFLAQPNGQRWAFTVGSDLTEMFRLSLPEARSLSSKAGGRAGSFWGPWGRLFHASPVASVVCWPSLAIAGLYTHHPDLCLHVHIAVFLCACLFPNFPIYKDPPYPTIASS